MTEKRVLLAVRIRPTSADAARNAVAALCGHPHFLTLGELVENGIAHAVLDLQVKTNKGRPFPKRKPGPVRGRRVK